MKNIRELYEEAKVETLKRKYYDAVKVDALVEQLLHKIDELETENETIFKGKRTVEETVAHARNAAEQYVENAREEANSIIQNGVSLSTQILQDAKEESQKIISTAERKADEIIEASVVKAADIAERAGKTVRIKKREETIEKQQTNNDNTGALETNLRKVIVQQEKILSLLNNELTKVKDSADSQRRTEIIKRLNEISQDIDFINGKNERD